MRHLPLALILGLAAASAATAQAVPDTAVKQAAPREKRICRSDTETGSIRPTRVCHSAAEWKAIDGVNHENSQRFDNQRMLNMAPSTTRG